MSRSHGGVAYGLDRLLENANRLALATVLSDPLAAEGLTYNEILLVLKINKGTLCVHARALEEAGYSVSRGEFAGRRTRTTYKLTPEGRCALEDHQYALAGLPTLLGLGLRDAKAPADSVGSAGEPEIVPAGEAAL